MSNNTKLVDDANQKSVRKLLVSLKDPGSTIGETNPVIRKKFVDPNLSAMNTDVAKDEFNSQSDAASSDHSTNFTNNGETQNQTITRRLSSTLHVLDPAVISTKHVERIHNPISNKPCVIESTKLSEPDITPISSADKTGVGPLASHPEISKSKIDLSIEQVASPNASDSSKHDDEEHKYVIKRGLMEKTTAFYPINCLSGITHRSDHVRRLSVEFDETNISGETHATTSDRPITKNSKEVTYQPSANLNIPNEDCTCDPQTPPIHRIDYEHSPELAGLKSDKQDRIFDMHGTTLINNQNTNEINSLSREISQQVIQLCNMLLMINQDNTLITLLNKLKISARSNHKNRGRVINILSDVIHVLPVLVQYCVDLMEESMELIMTHLDHIKNLDCSSSNNRVFKVINQSWTVYKIKCKRYNEGNS